MGGSLTEVSSRENGRREIRNSFQFLYKRKVTYVVVDGKIGSNIFLDNGRNNTNFTCSQERS